MADDPPLTTPWQAARRLRSEDQEQRLGKMVGGRKQVNSGRLWRWKRDAILHDFLVEARTTEANSYRVEREEFLKIESDGRKTPEGLLPAMQIDIRGLELILLRLTDFQNQEMRIVQLEAELEAARRKTGGLP